MPRGLKRDCKVMVAAQYILLAGQTLADDFLKKPVGDFGPRKLRRWAEKLKEISTQERSNTCLAAATDQACKYMVYLLPEIF